MQVAEGQMGLIKGQEIPKQKPAVGGGDGLDRRLL